MPAVDWRAKAGFGELCEQYGFHRQKNGNSRKGRKDQKDRLVGL